MHILMNIHGFSLHIKLKGSNENRVLNELYSGLIFMTKKIGS